MTDHRAVMRQALSALELDAYGEPARHERSKAIEALRAALNAPDGDVEPVAGEASNSEVICPACCHQFRAIPPNVQQLMLDAGFEPPFTHPPTPPQDANTITVRLTREQHQELRWLAEEFRVDMSDELLDLLGTFPDESPKS